MSGGRKIIEGLQDAVRGNFSRVTLQGQVWVRHDVGSPEHELSSSRAKVAELTERVDVLEAALNQIAALNDLSGYDDHAAAAYGHLAECEAIARKALEQ